MIKDPLYIKLFNYNFEELFNKKGYAYFTKGSYNLNIIGVRRNVTGNKVTNKFDDYLVVTYDSPTEKYITNIFNITTDPGRYYMQVKAGNINGTAILVPGQYRGCWKLGKHKGQYEALVQAKPVKVYRDGNLNDVYDLEPKTIQEGVFGINIHRASALRKTDTIDKYSAGCQVFSNPNDFKQFMLLCNYQRNIFGNSFTYTLLDEKEL